MSAIATFTLLPAAALPALRSIAATEEFHGFLQLNGKESAQYDWSGFTLATLLPYLDEKEIKLMKPDDELAAFLSKTRQATYFVFTPSHKQYIERLDPSLFAEAELRDYFNEFNASDEEDCGRAMLDGIAAFRKCLQAIDDDSVILFAIE